MVEERVRMLFEEIRVDHGIKTMSPDEIDAKAKAQWEASHDYIPTIEEIDKVIQEVRNARKS